MITIDLDQIKDLINIEILVQRIEEGFIQYSNGNCVVPPVGELLFDNPNGEVHIKSGYVIGGDYYVIKIASGFKNNYLRGIPNGQGMMLLFNQGTGEPLAVIKDEGYLTDIRTAIAGLICAKTLSNEINRIGIIGTGNQARLQAQFLKHISDCRDIVLWGRNKKNTEKCKEDLTQLGFLVKIVSLPNQVAKSCNLIITTTSSKTPLLKKLEINEGTHITAVGSDTPFKNELEPSILSMANIVVADSISQCLHRGEISHAIKKNDIIKDKIIELGSVLSGLKTGRTQKEQITVSDLTGVAIQDLNIAEFIYEKYLGLNK